MLSIKEVESMSAKALYRVLIKNMKYYPSKNRFPLLLSIKEELNLNIL